jgi:hypothetical protein
MMKRRSALTVIALGVHPTTEGYVAMNPVAERAIAAALAQH